VARHAPGPAWKYLPNNNGLQSTTDRLPLRLLETVSVSDVYIVVSKDIYSVVSCIRLLERNIRIHLLD
jgi:hypothetical protein